MRTHLSDILRALKADTDDSNVVRVRNKRTDAEIIRIEADTGIVSVADIGVFDTSLVINSDAAAATNEDPSLVLMGGDGGVDIVRTTLIQDSSAEITEFRVERSVGGGAYADIAPVVQIGESAQTADLDPVLRFSGGTGAANATADIRLDGSVDVLVVGDNATLVRVNAANGLRLDDNSELRLGGVVGDGATGGDIIITPDGTDAVITGAGDVVVGDDVDLAIGTTKDHAFKYVSGAARTDFVGLNVADGASGALRIDTGDSTSLTAANVSGAVTIESGTSTANGFNGGVSGPVALRSGTTSVITANTGGASGSASLSSGNTSATLAASTCGASGIVTVASGSTDVNVAGVATAAASGNVLVSSGGTSYLQAPGASVTAGASGTLTLQSGNCAAPQALTTSGASGNVALRSGTTVANDATPVVGSASGTVTVASGATNAAAATTGGASGNLTVQSGGTDVNDAGGTGGASGNVVVQSGDAARTVAGTSGASGSVTLESGTSVSATTGVVTVQSGNTTAAAADSGLILVTTGTTAVGRTSGTITVSTGNGTDAASGNTRVDSGDATSVTAARASGTMIVQSGNVSTGAVIAAGASGNLTVQSGTADAAFAGSTGGVSGTVIVQSGDATNSAGVASGASGTVTVESGTSVSGNTGIVTLQSGNSTGANSGNVVVQSGTGTAAGVSGNVSLTTGNLAGAGTSGSIVLTTGTAPGGTRGQVRLPDSVALALGTGAGVGDIVFTPDGTDVVITRVGAADLVLGDDVDLELGTSKDMAVHFDSAANAVEFEGVASAAANTAAFSLITGAATSTGASRQSGAVTIQSGQSIADTNAGDVSGNVIVGSGTTTAPGATNGGNSGTVTVASGACTGVGAGQSGVSGVVTLESGTSSENNTGNVVVRSGVPTAAGTSGNVAISTGATAGAGTSGNIALTTGATVGGTRGGIDLSALDLTIADDMPILIGAGSDLRIEHVSAGNINNIIGADAAGANSMALRLDTGNSTSVAGAQTSGAITIESGTTLDAGNAAGNTGAVAIRSGVSTAAAVGGGASGDVTIESGATVAAATAAGNTGAMRVASGNSTTNAAGGGGTTGNVVIQSGDAANAGAGASGASGTVTLESGTTEDVASGVVTIQSGNTTVAGNTGNVVIQSGDSAAAASGDIVLESGTAGTTRGILDINIPEINFVTQDTAFLLEDGAATALIIGATGATNMLTFDTQNGAEQVECAARLTTTDRVAAGTERIVGGLASGIVAAATSVDPAGGGDAAEVVVSTYTIPANTIKSGTTVRVDFAYTITVGATAETLVMRLRLNGLGGTLIAASTSMDPATGSGSGYAILKGRAAPSGASNVCHFGVIKDFAAAGADSAVVQQGPTVTAFATNGALPLVVTADWAAAEAAGGDTVSLEIFDVQVIG